MFVYNTVLLRNAFSVQSTNVKTIGFESGICEDRSNTLLYLIHFVSALEMCP